MIQKKVIPMTAMENSLEAIKFLKKMPFLEIGNNNTTSYSN